MRTLDKTIWVNRNKTDVVRHYQSEVEEGFQFVMVDLQYKITVYVNYCLEEDVFP